MKKGNKRIIVLLLGFVLIGIGLSGYWYYDSQKNNKKVVSQNTNGEQAAKKENTAVDTVKNQDEVKKEQEVPKETVSNAEGSKSESSKQTTSSDGKITQDKAVEIIGKYVSSKNQSAKVAFDHIQKRDGVDYFVLRAYEDMSDHIATLAWYYVDSNNGKAFEWNLTEDKLIPLEK